MSLEQLFEPEKSLDPSEQAQETSTPSVPAGDDMGVVINGRLISNEEILSLVHVPQLQPSKYDIPTFNELKTIKSVLFHNGVFFS